jgi:hypothetical protein
VKKEIFSVVEGVKSFTTDNIRISPSGIRT